MKRGNAAWHTCRRKVRHKSEYGAIRAIERLIREGRAEPGEMTWYECTRCKGFHVGHVRRAKVAASCFSPKNVAVCVGQR